MANTAGKDLPPALFMPIEWHVFTKLQQLKGDSRFCIGKDIGEGLISAWSASIKIGKKMPGFLLSCSHVRLPHVATVFSALVGTSAIVAV